MEIVNPTSSFQWSKHLNINNVEMLGNSEKQGVSFSRHGYLEAKHSGGDADSIGRAVRRRHRPKSAEALSLTRADYMARMARPFPRYFII
jgi:hypothetical protein